MSLIFATQLTAVATAVLAVFAIITGIYAIRAFLKQTQEVRDQAKMLEVQSEQLADQRKINAEQTGVLKLQAAELRESLEERKRDAEQRYRAQATQVFLTQRLNRTIPMGYVEQHGVEPFVTVTVTNTSDQPIYDAELRWHIGTADHREEPNPEPLGTVMPGKDEAVSKMRPFPFGTDLSNSGAVVSFTDANNVRWLRRADNYLGEFP